MAYSLYCSNAVSAINRDLPVLCPEAFNFASRLCVLSPLFHGRARGRAPAAAAEHRSVPMASLLHRGPPAACIEKRVYKLSVVCNRLREKSLKKNPLHSIKFR